MILKLLNYKNEPQEFDVGEKNSIGRIDISIMSGDELATVVYKDYSTRTYDSDTHNRLVGYPDGGYTIYNIIEGVDLLDSDKWMKRTTSYDFYDWPD